MPHDANGTVLRAGDLVRIPAVVKEVTGSEGYCNALLVTFIPMPPDNTDSSFWLNTKQVFKEE